MTGLSKYSLVAVAVAAAACSGAKPRVATEPTAVGEGAPAGAPASAPAATDVVETAPKLRLPRTFTPSAARVRLEVDPATPSFVGNLELDGSIEAGTSTVWLNAQHLTIRGVRLRVGQTETAIPSRVVGDDFLALGVHATGPVTFVIDYAAPFEEHETHGLFRQHIGDDWYAVTQLESHYARRVFPSVDEPDRKIPWTVTLDIPSKLVAFSNAAIAKEEPLDGGKKRVRFATTPPLPAYLFAIAVGPYDIVDAGKSATGTPVRIGVTRGRARDAAYAAEITPKILADLESWFGIPYPYGKLDYVAIPVTVGFTAMENAGLVTMKEAALLIDPANPSIARRERLAAVTTHELAHQWFGDLVTTAWWNDIWLNEGFASWMGDKGMDRLFPAWSRGMRHLEQHRSAFNADALATARMVRQPIASVDDIFNAFDSITYRKSASVLGMFERWIGPDKFRDGVRAYLAAHANGNATADDFIQALSTAAGRDLKPALTSFLDRPGVPRLSTSLRCEKGKPPTVTLAQDRYLARGAATDAAAAPWQMPVCIAYDKAGARAASCALLDQAQAEVALDARTCPRWVYPNADAAGYYHVAMDAAAVASLTNAGWAKLTGAERTALFDDVIAMAWRGDLPITAALELVPRMLREPSRVATEAAVNLVDDLGFLVPADRLGPWNAWIRRELGPRALALGWLPRKGDTFDVEGLRLRLVRLVAAAGEPRLRAEAVRLAARWRALPSSLRRPLLSVASDDPATYAALRDAAIAEPDRGARTDLLVALASGSRAEHVTQAIALAIDPRIDPRDAQNMFEDARKHRESQAAADAFARGNLPALLERAPREVAARDAELFTAACDGARRDEIAAFVKEHFTGLPGGPRVVAQSIETLDQCVARRALVEPALTSWLAKRK